MLRSFLLALAATVAMHVILFTALDFASVVFYREPEPAPTFELVEIIEPPKPEPPPPPPVKENKPEEPQEAPKIPPPKAPPKATPQVARTPSPPRAETPPDPHPAATDVPTQGGGPVLQSDQLGPNGIGTVPVARGKPSNHIGRGGTGTGTGSGVGSGSGESPPPPPVSVATIKKRALPKGDYGYLAAGKDYPEEAKRLGIQGALKVKLVISADGKVTSATLINKLGAGLDELALTQARQIEFTPAVDTNDQPVSSVVVWTFNFTLPK